MDKSAMEDIIRVKGINSLGFGIIPKYVMTASDLSAEAKGIYAYFCSFAGSGTSSFPSRGKILADLDISKDTYYKHFNNLIENGYISAEQQFVDGRYARNVYTLEQFPKNFASSSEKGSENTLSNEGIRSKGYGTVAKTVMTDSSITLLSKALYAYFCSFAGAGEVACPRKEHILFHLSVSDKTFRKHMQYLTKKGYIRASQSNNAGRFGVTDYIISEFLESSEKTEEIPCGKFSDTVISDTILPDTEKSDTSFSDSKISDAKTNKDNTNSNIISQSQNIYDGTKMSVVKIVSAGGCDFVKSLNDRKFAKDFVELLKGDDDECPVQDEEKYSVYRLFYSALFDLLTVPATRILKCDIPREEIAEKLVHFIDVSDDVISAFDLYENATEDYVNGCRKSGVSNPLGYMKSCIWNAMQEEDSKINAKIIHDFR